jgi:hypothetical protein
MRHGTEGSQAHQARCLEKERKKAELAAGRAALVAIAEFKAVAKDAAAIKEALEETTLTIV